MEFKAPDQGGGESQTYFMFEDLGNIYVAFSNGRETENDSHSISNQTFHHTKKWIETRIP